MKKASFVRKLIREQPFETASPGSGSMRYAMELRLAGLHAWPVRRFPQIVFYVEGHDHVDVWRVLHGMRDIPAWMREIVREASSSR